MQVTIVTFGSRGDVQPFVHLATGFREAGHRVRLCTHEAFSELASGRHIEFVSLGVSDPIASQKADYEKRPKTKLGVLWRVLLRQTKPDWEELEKLEDAIAGSDLVVCNHLADSTYHLTEKLKIPCAFAYLHPTHPTRSFASTICPQALRTGPIYNILTHLALRHLYWIKNRRWINEWRTQKLGLIPLSWFGPFRAQYKKRIPYVFGFSGELVPPINDWPGWYQVAGYWFDPQPPADEVGNELRNFVESGDKPIVIAFGSVASPLMPQILAEIVSSIKQLRSKAVIVAGWGEHSLQSAEDVLIVPSAPYGWLFRRAAIVVHAGGSGTVAEVARAGVPSIPVPFAAEQRFWSYRLWKMGVAAKPIPHTEVNHGTVLAALEQINTQSEMGELAVKLAQRVAKEGGTRATVEFLSRRIFELRGATAEPGTEVN